MHQLLQAGRRAAARGLLVRAGSSCSSESPADMVGKIGQDLCVRSKVCVKSKKATAAVALGWEHWLESQAAAKDTRQFVMEIQSLLRLLRFHGVC